MLIRQGEEGDAYYAIAAGELDVVQDGRFLRRCGRGEGVGEIALLRAVPRTASVTAHTDTVVYKLARQPFLTAVLGHAATQRQAHSIVDAHLAADATRDNDPAAAGEAEPALPEAGRVSQIPPGALAALLQGCVDRLVLGC